MRRSLGILLALCVAGTEACSLFVSLDELSGGSDAAGTDGATDVATDVVTANDSGSKDGSTAADADAGPFCAAHPGHAVCADFDQGDIETGFTTTDLQNSGTLSRDTSHSVSAPASMASILPAVGASSSAARLEYDVLLSTTNHIHVELDIQLCDLSTSAGDLEVFKFNQGIGQFADGIELSFAQAGGHLDVEAASQNIVLTGDVPRQEWVHLAIDLVRATSGSIRLELNGDTTHPLVDATNLDTSLDNDGGAASILVGTYGFQTPACVTYYDNVVIDTK